MYIYRKFRAEYMATDFRLSGLAVGPRSGKILPPRHSPKTIRWICTLTTKRSALLLLLLYKCMQRTHKFGRVMFGCRPICTAAAAAAADFPFRPHQQVSLWFEFPDDSSGREKTTIYMKLSCQYISELCVCVCV